MANGGKTLIFNGLYKSFIVKFSFGDLLRPLNTVRQLVSHILYFMDVHFLVGGGHISKVS